MDEQGGYVLSGSKSWMLVAGGVVSLFVLIHFVTRPHPAPTKAKIEEASCTYTGTDERGAHLYRVKARGTAAGPADVMVNVDTVELGFPLPSQCIQWGRACYRDPAENKKTEWSSDFEFGTVKTPYTVTVRATTRGSYVTVGRNAPKKSQTSMEVVCGVTESEPVVAGGAPADEEG